MNPRAGYPTYTLSRGTSSANLSTSPNDRYRYLTVLLAECTTLILLYQSYMDLSMNIFKRYFNKEINRIDSYLILH